MFMHIIIKAPPILFRKALTLYSLFAGPTLRGLEIEISEIYPILGAYLNWWKNIRARQDEFYECLLGNKNCRGFTKGIKLLERLEFRPKAPKELVVRISRVAESLEKEKLLCRMFIDSKFEVFVWESPQNRTVEPFPDRKFCMLWKNADPLAIKFGLVHGMLVTELGMKIEDMMAVEALSDLIELELFQKLGWIDRKTAREWWNKIQNSEEAREYKEWVDWAKDKVKEYKFTPLRDWVL